jgi:hypothetical protein
VGVAFDATIVAERLTIREATPGAMAAFFDSAMPPGSTPRGLRAQVINMSHGENRRANGDQCSSAVNAGIVIRDLSRK